MPFGEAIRALPWIGLDQRYLDPLIQVSAECAQYFSTFRNGAGYIKSVNVVFHKEAGDQGGEDSEDEVECGDEWCWEVLQDTDPSASSGKEKQKSKISKKEGQAVKR